MEIEMNNEGDIQRLKVDQYGIDNLNFCLYLNQSHTTRTIIFKKKFLYTFIKRLFDIVASIFALIILAIPMLIIGIVVKLTSKGPMIYVSTRIGKNGKRFRFYKFRSMRKDAEKELSQLLEKNEVKGGVTFKMENDPRVTKYGRFLRKTSLDELPQLLNILKGDMTFVGPRPCTDRESFDSPFKAKNSLFLTEKIKKIKEWTSQEKPIAKSSQTVNFCGGGTIPYQIFKCNKFIF